MRESHLSKIEERLIRPYLLRRADYATHVRDLNELIDDMSISANGSGSSNANSSNDIAINGISQAAIFGGGPAGSNDLEKATRLKNILIDLERWSKEEDSQVNTSNMKALENAVE